MKMRTLSVLFWMQTSRLLAQEPAPPTAANDVTEYRFEDSTVRAGPKEATGEVLTVRTRQARGSLIRIREHFAAELLKSVEWL